MSVKDDAGPAMERHIEVFVREGDKVLNRVANEHIAQARLLARQRLKRPGRYLESFRTEPERLLIRAINFHRVAKLIELGSRPHPIPRGFGKTLRFFKEGVTKFRKSVWHPGTRPLFIMLDSARKTVPFFTEQCNRLREAMKVGS